MGYAQGPERPRFKLVPAAKRELMDRRRAEQARQAVFDLDLPEFTRVRVLEEIESNTKSERSWLFIMVNSEQNSAVVDYLAKASPRPMLAARIWACLLDSVRVDSGEVLKTRAEIAARVGANVRDVSRVMTVLERVNAVIRKPDGRGVRYFVNSNVGTHLPGAARDRAQLADGELPLLLVLDGDRRA